MKQYLLVTLFTLISGFFYAYGQNEVQRKQIINQSKTGHLQKLKKAWQEQYSEQHKKALQKAGRLNLPVRKDLGSGRVMELQRIAPNGMPVYYITDNLNAAKTIRTNEVWQGGAAGLSLSGNSMIIGEWDEGAVLASHQELSGRVTQMDTATQAAHHATHIAGTMISEGISSDAKGMAFEASLNAWDWGNDDSEMAEAAANGLLVSNHSYGTITGWHEDSQDTLWYWYGDTTLNQEEDHHFGFYNQESKNWDEIANNAPYYLMVKSAGNDSGEGPAPGTEHKVWDSQQGKWVNSITTRPKDGGSSGYDCISPKGVAKNLLTVGSIGDITGGYTDTSDVDVSDFSGWGPTDDGRIKPDVVANGKSLFSTLASGDTDYGYFTGTSMAAPGAAGSLLLLQEHFNDSQGQFMLASTLKSLVIHTANEAGTNEGPDYRHGWGVINTEQAADLISASGDSTLIIENTLINEKTVHYDIYASGNTPLEVTLGWTDVPGTPADRTVDPSQKMLVNDLDVRITDNDSTYLPYVLDPANPGDPANRGDNVRDNMEKIYFDNVPEGNYRISISHKDTLSGNYQAFSMIVSGLSSEPVAPGNLEAGKLSSTQIKLKWEDNSLNETGFIIERSANISRDNDLLIADEGDGWVYQWFLNGEALPDGQSRTLQMKEGGNYQLRVSNSSGCTVLSEVRPVLITGVKALNETSVKVYPNPASRNIQISTDENWKNSRFTLINMEGKAIRKGKLNGTLTNLNLKNAPAGIYMILFRSGLILKKIKLQVE